MMLIILAFSFCCFASLFLLHRAFREKEAEIKSKRLAEVTQNFERVFQSVNSDQPEGNGSILNRAFSLFTFLPAKKQVNAELITIEGADQASSGLRTGAVKYLSIGIGAGAFLIVNFLILQWELLSLNWYLGMCCSSVAFYGLPKFLTGWKRKRYKDEIERAVPDFLDLLVLSVDSGLSFDAGLAQCRKFSAVFSKALDKELVQLAAELTILPSRRQALESLVLRTGSETLGYLTIALNQGEKYGTPIRASLRTVAKESRRKRLVAIERNGARLPVILSLPLMLLILPPVIAISAGPGFISLLRSIGGS